jgi:hypothetical protein
MKRGFNDRWLWMAAGIVMGAASLAWAVQVSTLITDTGTRVGVGTTSPTELLHVEGGKILIRNATANPSMIFDNAVGTQTADFQFKEAGVLRANLRFSADTNGATFELQDRTGGATQSRLFVKGNGRVGIGTNNPGAQLHVTSDIRVDGNIAAKYQDVAEWVDAKEKLSAGTVVVIDQAATNHVRPAATPYDDRVAGVVTERPGVILGDAAAGRAKIAHSGRVRVKADATYGTIGIGDLLVTSATTGHVMRSSPVDVNGVPFHRPGTVVGKALEPLQAGVGEILVLLTLQ